MTAIATTSKAKELVGPYVWTTQTGERIPVTKMRTTHVFHSIRMVYNNTCPKGWQTRNEFKRYILNRPVEYWREATAALMEELATRKDLTPGQLRELAVMVTNIRLYFARCLPRKTKP